MPALGNAIKQGELLPSLGTMLILIGNMLIAMAGRPEYSKPLVELQSLIDLTVANVLTQVSTILKRIVETKGEKLAADLEDLKPKYAHVSSYMRIGCAY